MQNFLNKKFLGGLQAIAELVKRDHQVGRDFYLDKKKLEQNSYIGKKFPDFFENFF